jgi:hypothetical protein
MGLLSFLKKEDPNLSDFSEIVGVHELKKTRKRPLSSALAGSSHATKAGKGVGKKVSFYSVTVRYYNLILGDNDGCNVPLAIGWKWVESEPMPVDIYDMMHHQGPDYVCAMKLSPIAPEERKRRLYATGHSKQDVRREERRRRIQLAMQVAYQATKTVDDSAPSSKNTSIFIERYLLN